MGLDKEKNKEEISNGFRRNGFGEVTTRSIPKVPPKDAAPLLKVEKEKWWTLGRGRKDSKEKTKENKEINKMSSKRKSSPINPCLSQF
jgi:serine/arginine repetitive matrix protein 2